MERKRKYKFMLFYLLRNFVINKKFLMCWVGFVNSCEYDYESPFAIKGEVHGEQQKDCQLRKTQRHAVRLGL
jgi:hypothetical protein